MTVLLFVGASAGLLWCSVRFVTFSYARAIRVYGNLRLLTSPAKAMQQCSFPTLSNMQFIGYPPRSLLSTSYLEMAAEARYSSRVTIPIPNSWATGMMVYMDCVRSPSASRLCSYMAAAYASSYPHLSLGSV